MSESASTKTTILDAGSGWKSLDLAELWRYRDLAWFFALRDIQIRYKQTFFGGAWAILQPFLTMVIFSVFFGRLAGIPSHGVPYPLFVYSALVPWQLFSTTLTQASGSMVQNRALITKIYFPRLIVPLAPILCGLVDFAFSFLVLVAMAIYYKVQLTSAIALLPMFVLGTLVTSFAVGVWLSALNALYRDIQYTTGFLVQVWMYVSPVVYPASLVPAKYRWIYALNPMVGMIEGFRWALLGVDSAASMKETAASFASVALILVAGLFYFRRMERTLADVV